MIIRDNRKHDDHTIMVRLTNHCNVNCDYCFLHSNSFDKSVMNETTINATIKYIDKLCHKYTTNLILSGGELGLLDQNIIKQFISKVQSLEYPTSYNQYQTSLLYKVTRDHLETFKLFDIVCISYDQYRLSTKSRRNLFFNNLQILKDNNIPISLLFLLDKETVTNVTPKQMFDIAIEYNAKILDFWTLYNNQYAKDCYNEMRLPNKQVNHWIFKAYLERERNIDYQQLICNVFDSMEQALVGINFYCHSRSCNEHQFSVNTDGSISCCDFRYNTNYGSVFSPDEDKRKYWIKLEKDNIATKCKSCQYFKYCKGGCFHLSFDETDCGIPHQIFEYLLSKNDV